MYGRPIRPTIPFLPLSNQRGQLVHPIDVMFNKQLLRARQCLFALLIPCRELIWQLLQGLFGLTVIGVRLKEIQISYKSNLKLFEASLYYLKNSAHVCFSLD